MSLLLSASGDRIDFGSPAILDNLHTNPFSGWALVYRDTNGTNQHIMTKDNSFPSGWSFAVVTGAGEGTLTFVAQRATATTQFSSDASNLVPLNTWYWVGFAYDPAGSPQCRLFMGPLSGPIIEVTGYSATTAGSGAPNSDAAANLIGGNLQRNTALNWKGRIARLGLATGFLAVEDFQRLEWENAITLPASTVWASEIWGLSTSNIDLTGNGNGGTVTGCAVADHPPVVMPYGFATAEPVGGLSVTDTTKPVFSAGVVNTTGLLLDVTLLESGSPPVLPSTGVTGFTVKANTVTQTVSSAVRLSSTVIRLTLSAALLSTDTVTVEYTPGNVTDSAGSPNAMDAFGAQAVTNNSTVGASDTTPPVFASAVLDTTGLLLDVTLTEAGSAPVLPATGVTGFAATVAAVSRSITSAVRLSSVMMRMTLSSAATAGQTVTIAYTPGNVTDSAGSPNAMTAFGAQAVTNNSTVPASGTITMDNSLIIVNKDMWAVRNATRMATNQQGSKFRYGVTVASNDNQTMTMDVSGMSGVSASTTPTIMAWMDDVPLDLAGDGKNYLQLSNAGGTQTVTLKTAPANGFHVLEFQVRSFEQTSGAYLSIWGPGGGARPPVAVVLTSLGIGANSSLTALTPGTHYPTASIMIATHSRGLGVLAQLRQGDSSTATTAANNNISCSWPAFVGYGDGYEVSWRGHGGCDLDLAGGSPVSGLQHPAMMGATPLTGAEPTLMGTAWNGLLWSASDAPAYQGHYAILVMQGALNSPSAAKIQAACTKIRSIWGGTPYIFWCSDPTRVNNSAMVAGVAAAAAALSDTKIQMLDTGISFMNIAGNVPNRNSTDGSHPILPGQAAIAAAISYKLRQLTSAGGGSGSGGRKSMGMGI